MKHKKILITGGHATPAFAVINELRRHSDFKFVWVGEKHNQKGNRNPSAEYVTVTKEYKIPFINLKSGKLVRKWDKSNFISAFLQFPRIFLGSLKALFIILSVRPRIILSFGGFTAVPIVFWAHFFGIRVITHEQTIVSGLANRIIAKYADKVLVSWASSIDFFPEKKVVLTGNPIREDIFEIRSEITKNLDPNLPIIYITGGNQGAHEINFRVFAIINDLLEIANVIHQTGNSSVTKDYEKGLSIYEELDEIKKKRYVVKSYVGIDEIGEVLNKSDLIISRSGANTICEILALGKHSILIPIPWTSGDEQEKNAQLVADIGLALKLTQTDNLEPNDLYNAIVDGLDRVERKIGFGGIPISVVKEEASGLIKIDAASLVAGIVIKMAYS